MRKWLREAHLVVDAFEPPELGIGEHCRLFECGFSQHCRGEYEKLLLALTEQNLTNLLPAEMLRPLLPFAPPGEFELAPFDGNGRFGSGGGKRVRLSARLSKPPGVRVMGSRLPAVQEWVEGDDTYLTTAMALESEQLRCCPPAFDNPVHVLAPAVVAAAVNIDRRSS